jgi:acetyl-CoA carboxylase/biotin carboxylase 1
MPVLNGGSKMNGHGSSYAAKHNLPSHFIGGNHLTVAPPSKVKDFVASHDGHSVITSVWLFFSLGQV